MLFNPTSRAGENPGAPSVRCARVRGDDGVLVFTPFGNDRRGTSSTTMKQWVKMMNDIVIDKRGFRLGVGMVIMNRQGELLWGRRVGNPDAWQFPQGGLLPNETLREALNRELDEEVGLSPHDVIYLRETRQWISYRLPKKFRRPEHRGPVCIGQRQKWFLLQFTGKDDAISLDHCSQPEFDQWRWVDYWYPVDHVVEFKRDVYQKVITEFAEFIR